MFRQREVAVAWQAWPITQWARVPKAARVQAPLQICMMNKLCTAAAHFGRSAKENKHRWRKSSHSLVLPQQVDHN